MQGELRRSRKFRFELDGSSPSSGTSTSTSGMEATSAVTYSTFALVERLSGKTKPTPITCSTAFNGSRVFAVPRTGLLSFDTGYSSRRPDPSP